MIKPSYLIGAAVVVFAGAVMANVSAQSNVAIASQAPRVAAPPAVQTPPPARTYVGSLACQACHEATYERWSKTRMANVVTNPKEHPELVLPDFTKPDPLLTFKLSDVAFVYGTKWKQRYFTKVGDDYFPLGAQWDVTHKLWRRYFVRG